MEKLLNLLNIEMISYFSPEIICFIAILINIFMFLFLPRKFNIKRISDITTFSAFSINSLLLGAFLIRNYINFANFNFEMFNGLIVFNNQNLLFSFLINAFLALFVLCMYKTIKARFKMTLVNSSLLFLAIFSCVLIHIQNPLLAFILLDACVYFIYKSASSARIKKPDTYSPDFILISACGSVLFYLFYFLTSLIKDSLQLQIIEVCIASVILLKAGIFPIYNYSITRKARLNVAWATLLFTFLPFLGLDLFIKYSTSVDFSNEIYFISLNVFIVFCVVFASITAFKAKNLIRFLANIFQVVISLCLIAFLSTLNSFLCQKSATIAMFAFFALFNALAILKINNKTQKLNLNLIKGLFVKNRKFCLVFSILLLMVSNVIPSVLLFNNFELVNVIYKFDYITSWISAVFLLANILILLNVFNIVKTMYVSKSEIVLTKRTTLNYVVLSLIIILLEVLMFL